MAISYAACSSCGSLNRYETSRSNSATCGRCKASLPVHGAVTEVDHRGLKSLITKSPLPVVVDYWAPWCGPCLSFAPAFEDVAARLADQFVFAKANTQDHPDVASGHGIRGIPTLIIFQDGKELTRQSGAASPQAFEQWLRTSVKAV